LTVAQSAVTDLTTDLGNKAPAANPTFTGTAKFPDGSASAPSITNTGDTDTGISFPADNAVAISTNGSERLRVIQSGYVGIGTTNSAHHLEVSSANAFEPRIGIRNTNTGDSPGFLIFEKDPSDDSISTNDGLGAIRWRAPNTGGTQVDAVEIRVSAGSNNDATGVAGVIGFFTAPVGSGVQERMRVDANGLITGTGTSLGAWTAYTPTISGTGWAIGNGTTDCAYAQIGKVVFYRVEIVFGSTSTYGAGAPTISSPVAGKSGKTTVHNNGLYFDASLTQQFPSSIQHLDSTFFPRTLASPTAAVTSAVPFTWTTSDIIRFHGVYEAS
jgi:hypothetical protein